MSSSARAGRYDREQPAGSFPLQREPEDCTMQAVPVPGDSDLPNHDTKDGATAGPPRDERQREPWTRSHRLGLASLIVTVASVVAGVVIGYLALASPAHRLTNRSAASASTSSHL